MQFAIIFRILGILLMVFSFTQLFPVGIAIIYDENTIPVFFSAFVITLVCGLALWLPVYKRKGDLRTRDGFLITSLFWLVLGSFGSLPFILSEDPHLTVTNAIFESISGLTTTGATVITGLDELPRSILFYRQQLQWLGGIGIIVIAVAILPMLGIGGMQLYKAETPGPVKDSKLTPRITGTAKALFLIYFFLTISCAFGYWLAGMNIFDAVSHSFSTVATGGHSTHDASFAFYEGHAVKLVAICFMFIASIIFALHFFTWQRRSLIHYLGDPEFLFYAFILSGSSILITTFLFHHGGGSFTDVAVDSMFQVISITSSTGFSSTNFSIWPTFVPWLLIFLSFIGGCASSTAGGIKVIRILIILKQGLRELKKLVYPKAMIPLKLKKQQVPEAVTSAVWGFFSVYIVVFVTIVITLIGSGLNFETAFSATAACINNLGPGLGDVASHYGDINNFSKWVLSLAMLLGRLEIFTLLVLFTPAFWRR